jgi:hypothetical protein
VVSHDDGGGVEPKSAHLRLNCLFSNYSPAAPPPSPLSSRPERSVVERSLCGCSFLGMFFERAEQPGGGDRQALNGDAFSSKDQGVDGPGTRAEHGKTDGENGDQNVTLVLRWT